MKIRKTLMSVFAVLIISSIVLAACAAPEPEVVIETVVVTETETETIVETVEVVVEAEPEVDYGPVTFHGYSTTDVPTMDPQLGEDVVSINYIEQLFVHLTNYDLDTAAIVPEAATAWDISEDGLTYTFTIRTDIPWVKYNTFTGETIQEVDEEGTPRFVTAHDFEFGIKRACNPNTGSYYSSIAAPNIVGCEDVLYYELGDDEEDVPAEMYDAIGVTATDDATLVIELPFPAAYFLSMTPMWTITATPSWAIEAHGDQWIEPGNIVTNGRYVLEDWVHGVGRSVIRNPLMPADMHGGGNIERFVTNVVPDGTTGYALWLNGEVETSGIPDAELEAHLAEFADETVQIPDLAVFYIAFRMTKAPFDNVHVRRAFSAAFDRQTFVDEVRQGQGLPMSHFAPPGIFGAPPINEVGVGYNVEYAQEQLALAGYPNCEGFPQVSLLGYSGQSTLNWIEFAQANWSENLGCSPDLITIEQQSFGELLATTKADDAEAPNMWTLGWGPDYADENNWVGDVLSCETALRMKRECNEIDEKIQLARTSTDPAERIALYAEIEDMFFGEEGEFPFFPIFLRIAYVAEHSWLTRTPALFGGDQWYTWNLDQAAQMAAQE
ncbi:MAG: peptide ABC transporter substrate-binding protein [Chloroflexota bacterium]